MRAALGSIERLDTGRYRVSIEGPRNAEGKRTRKSKVVRGTREDAEIALAKMKLDAGRADGDADSMTVDAAWRVFYEPTLDGRLAPATCAKYRSDYAHNIRPIFGGEILSSLDARRIEQGLARIQSDYPRDHAFRLMRTFFNYMWNRDLITSNPFQKRVEVKSPRKREQPVMGVSQLRAWTDGLRGFPYEAVMLMYPYAGLRRGEGCGLRTEDLDFADGMMLARISRAVDDSNVVREVKTERSERTVVIAGPIAERMRYLVAGTIPGWLAQDADGMRIHPHLLSKRYKSWCAAHGIPWYTIQQLRTTYATLSQASGVDAAVTSRALGHTKLSTDYAHYFMANAPAQIAAAHSLAAMLASPVYGTFRV